MTSVAIPPNKTTRIKSQIASGSARLARRPMHSRTNALGQNHHFVLLPSPSAWSPTSPANMPLLKTW